MLIILILLVIFVEFTLFAISVGKRISGVAEDDWSIERKRCFVGVRNSWERSGAFFVLFFRFFGWWWGYGFWENLKYFSEFLIEGIFS